MTERTSTTEPVRRRIGDRESRGFPPPTSAPPEGDEQPTTAEQPAPPADHGADADPGAEDALAQGRRQIIPGAHLRRDPNQIHTNDAGISAGQAPPAISGAEGRRSIGDRPAPQPATQEAASRVAVAGAPVREPSLDEPVIDTHPAVEESPVGETKRAKRSKRRSPGRPTRSTVLVGALIVVLLAAAIFFGLKWRSQDNLDGLRSSALSSAKADGVLLSSYDYRNLTGPGSAWANVEKNATPAFRKNFLSTSGTLGKLLSQYNATATGKVISAGVASFSSSRAVVLLFIDQTVNNTVQKSASATQPLRTQVTLLQQNGRWLIDDLQVPK